MAKYETHRSPKNLDSSSILDWLVGWLETRPDGIKMYELCHGIEGDYLNPEKELHDEPDDWCLLDVFDAWLTHHDGTIRCQSFQAYLEVVFAGMALWSDTRHLMTFGRDVFSCGFRSDRPVRVSCTMLPLGHASGYGGNLHPALQESHFLRLRGEKLAKQMDSQVEIAERLNAVLDTLRIQQK